MRPGVSEYLPLTPAQQGMLADSMVLSDAGIYVEQVVGEMTEPLDVERFRSAWLETVRVFDALRLRIRLPHAGPAACFADDEARLRFSVEDVRAPVAPGVPGESRLAAFLAADRQRGIDVRADTLMRVTVLHLDEESWAFVWTLHHAIIDGHSYARVLRHVFAHYDGHAALGRPSAGPPFATFARWLAAQDVAEGVRRFDDMLAGVEGTTPLPLAAETTQRTWGHTADVRVRLSVGETAAVVAGAQAVSATLNTALHLAWGLLLARYAGLRDVVFATTWSGRSGPLDGVTDIVGPCVNTLPVRVTCVPGETVRDALAHLRHQHRSLRPYRNTPFSRLEFSRGAAGAPQRMATIVVFDPERFDAVLARDGEQWSRRRLWSRSGTSYALGLAAHLDRGELVLDLEYVDEAYDEATARRLLTHYRRLLSGIAEHPFADPLALPLVEPATEVSAGELEAARERRTDAPSPIVRFFEEAAAHPDAIAVVEAQGPSITYEALARRVLTLASAIPAPAGGTPALVGVYVPRSIDAVVALLAVHAAGAAFLPLDPTYPPARLDYLIRDSGIAAMLVTPTTAGQLTAWTHLERRVDAEAPPRTQRPDRPDPDALAYVIYTSGSTGDPKGVCIPHGALASHAESAIALYQLRPGDRVLQFSALSVDVAVEEIFPTLAVGATLVLRDDDMGSSGRECLEAMQRLGVTVANLPTAFWRLMTTECTTVPWPETLRLLVVGGERVSLDDLRAFRRADTSHIRWINGYGPTETTITSTSYDDADGDHDDGEVPIGRPWPGVSHFVFDPQRRPVPPGGVGELFIGGAGLALGYLNRPALTAERFPAHPYRSGARLYATGDLVRTNARGQFLFVGRRDHQVKVRGFRVELGEIEARIRQHPGVADAAVVTRQHPGHTELSGFVVARSADLTPEALHDYLAAALPAYMIPRLAIVGGLPLTPGGKVDRARLESETVTTSPTAATKASADPTEAKLQHIWAELLGQSWIDPLATFFDAGGHSLSMVQMLALVEQRFNRAVDVRAFLPTPTIHHLAALVRRGKDADWAAPLIELARGHPRLRPLFVAPGIGGWGLDYRHLADALHPDVPVLALQGRGLREGVRWHATLGEAAQEYADVMQAAEPQGPYAVAGFSAGAVVALAIAEALTRRGQRTDFVGLLDGIPPPTIPVPSPFTHPRRLARYCVAAIVRARDLFMRRGSSGAWARLRQATARRAGGDSSAKRGLLVHDLIDGLDVGVPAHHLEFMQAHLDAVSAFVPGGEAIDVVLFRTAIDPLEGPHEPDLGWKRATRGVVTIERVPGYHEDLLTARGAPGLARHIEPFLLTRAARE